MLYYIVEYIRQYVQFPEWAFSGSSRSGRGRSGDRPLIAFWVGPKVIRFLRKRQIGRPRNSEGPNPISQGGHPDDGGLIVLAATVIPALLWADIKNGYVLLILFTTIWLRRSASSTIT